MKLIFLTTLSSLFLLLLETIHHTVSIKMLFTSLAFALFGTNIVILIVVPAALSLSRKSLSALLEASMPVAATAPAALE